MPDLMNMFPEKILESEHKNVGLSTPYGNIQDLLIKLLP